jgi:hypothetical protein
MESEERMFAERKLINAEKWAPTEASEWRE